MNVLNKINGGWGGIRTHGGLSPSPVFKTGTFNRSVTHPINYLLCNVAYRALQVFYLIS